MNDGDLLGLVFFGFFLEKRRKEGKEGEEGLGGEIGERRIENGY